MRQFIKKNWKWASLLFLAGMATPEFVMAGNDNVSLVAEDSQTACPSSLSNQFPGKVSSWNGSQRYDFKFSGRDVVVVAPQKVVSGRPWIWRPACFEVSPSIDQKLLANGFHVVYYDPIDLYGNSRADQLGADFYKHMTNQFTLSSKVTLEGLNRGCYFAINWAAAHPDKVACIYLDASVSNRKNAEAFLGQEYKENALKLVTPLVKGRVPIVAGCGLSDLEDSSAANFKTFRDVYQQAGGIIELIQNSVIDSANHKIGNSERVVDFMMRYQEGMTRFHHINKRGSLANSFSRFYHEKKGCVAFLGGSITYNKGWKEQVKLSLQQRFPETQFKFIDAGIGSTGSTPHAFRLENDVLNKGIPDLLFYEAAVNDYSNGFDAVQQVRGMEGIARHMRTVNPNADMIMLHFIVDPFIPLLNKGINPDVIMNHERVANWYFISSINLAREVAERMAAGEFTWKDFGGVHPCWNGNKNYSRTINYLFDAECYELAHLGKIIPHELPMALDAYSFDNGHFMDVREAKKLHGFNYVTDWMPSVHTQAQLRPGFHHVPMLESTREGASFELEFEGKAIGIFCVAGPASGKLEYQIDNGPKRVMSLFARASKRIYLPRVYMFDSELTNTKHTLTVRLVSDHGEECQIRNFVVNK